MIVEGDEHDRFRHFSNPKSAQVVKVSGAVKKKRSEMRLLLLEKAFDQARRRGKTKMRTPAAQVPFGQPECALRPRVIQVEMKGADQIR
jgi:hypothetical protein